jgi:hypothetical protein
MTTNVLQARTQRCVQADMKTLMLTKCRRTTYMDEKMGLQTDKQTFSQVGGQIDRQAGGRQA